MKARTPQDGPLTRHMMPTSGKLGEHVEGLSEALRSADLGDLVSAVAQVEAILDRGDVSVDAALYLRKHLIDWFGQMGMAAESRRTATAAAQEARVHLGPRHEMTLVMRSSELYWMCMSGYDDVAQRRFPELIRDVEKRLGPRDPLAWAVRTNSAMPLKRVGDFAGAARVYRRLLQDMSGVLEDTDMLVMTTRDNLAEVLAGAGRFEESTRLYEALLVDMLAMSRVGDRRVLRLRDEIAANAFCAGDFGRARELWGVLAEDCRRHLGECDPETARQRTLQILLAVEQDDPEAVVHWCRVLLDNLPEDFEREDVEGFREVMRTFADRCGNGEHAHGREVTRAGDVVEEDVDVDVDVDVEECATEGGVAERAGDGGAGDEGRVERADEGDAA